MMDAQIIVPQFYQRDGYLEFYRIPVPDIVSNDLAKHIHEYEKGSYRKIGVIEDGYTFKPSKNDTKPPLFSSDFVRGFENLNGIGFILNNTTLDFLKFDNVQKIEIMNLGFRQKKKTIEIDHLEHLAYAMIEKTDTLCISRPMPKMLEFRMKSYDITNMDFKMLPNLLSLSMICPNHDMNLTNIGALKSLKGIEIFGKGNSDISFLTELDNLEALIINGYNLNLKKLPDFSKMKKLKWLAVFGLPTIADYSPFAEIENLEKLYVEYKKTIDVDSLKPLLNCKNLKRIGGFVDLPSKDRKRIMEMFKHNWDNLIGADSYHV